MTQPVTIEEGLEKLQEFTLEFLKGLHAYITRVEERKRLYKQLRQLALSIGLTEAELPPNLGKTTTPTRREWSPEQRQAAAERMRARNAAKGLST